MVLDTNVLLSGLAYPQSAPGRIVAAWRGGALDVVSSPYLLDELRRVLPRLAHRHRMSPAEQEDLVETLALLAESVEPGSAHLRAAGAAGLLRDAADVPVLAALPASGADYLVTGDRDLLALGDRHPIVTPAEFEARHAP